MLPGVLYMPWRLSGKATLTSADALTKDRRFFSSAATWTHVTGSNRAMFTQAVRSNAHGASLLLVGMLGAPCLVGCAAQMA